MQIGGHAAPGFERVTAEFAKNFSERGDIGAAFAVVRAGETVVDLWGGLADSTTGRRWTNDTLQLIFSGTKGLVALCLLMLVDRGQIQLEQPVATYWPEFGTAGKDTIHVREVVSHQAGLPGIAAAVSTDDVVDYDKIVNLLAEQPVFDDPRARKTYHPLTFGWLCGELVRRIDGRSVGTFFAEEIAQPLELELWIGLPEHLESRVSTLKLSPNWESWPTEDELESDPLLRATYANPPFAGAPLPWNRHDWHAAEIPGVNAIGTARSVARLYGCLALGGELEGVRLLAESTLRLGLTPIVKRIDALTQMHSAFATGFALQTEQQQFGQEEDAYGHPGMGGSIHGAWPGYKVGFSYAMNNMRNDTLVDPRPQALLAALHDTLQNQTKGSDSSGSSSDKAPPGYSPGGRFWQLPGGR